MDTVDSWTAYLAEKLLLLREEREKQFSYMTALDLCLLASFLVHEVKLYPKCIAEQNKTKKK